MAQKLPLSDFRAVRYKLEPHEFALSEGPDPPPTNLIDEATWAGIMHLPDDVAIRLSDHNGLAAGITITASDGETRHIGAGEIVLVEDTTGKGAPS